MSPELVRDLQGWRDAALKHLLGPRGVPGPDHGRLVRVAERWNGPISRGVLGRDRLGPYIAAELCTYQGRGTPYGGPWLFDPEAFFVLLGHILWGGGLSLAHGGTSGSSAPSPRIELFRDHKRVCLHRLVAGTPPDRVAPILAEGPFDCRRAALQEPGRRQRGNRSAGREEAIALSLDAYSGRICEAVLGMRLAGYERMLRDGYAILDALRPTGREEQW